MVGAPAQVVSASVWPAAVAGREVGAPVTATRVRGDDGNGATPEDVLVAISAWAARARTPVAHVPELVTAERSSLADAVAIGTALGAELLAKAGPEFLKLFAP